MNKARRKAIESATNALRDAKEILEQARNEEQEYYDNMPESIQGSERGETASNAIENLEEAIDTLDTAISAAEGATNQ